MNDRSDLFSVGGLVAVITGGGSGLGRYMARALAANGAERVYILGRRPSPLQECASAYPTVIVPVQCDITSKDSISAAVNSVTSSFPGRGIDLLVLNAGVPGPRSSVMPSTSPLEEFVAAHWEIGVDEYLDPFRTHLAACWFVALGFLGLLDAGNRWADREEGKPLSQILVVSSAGAFNRATLGNFAYAQSKAAQVYLSKQLATLLVPYRIRTNALCPGVFPSELAAWTAKAGVLKPENFPVGRLGHERDMAGMILFLASPAGGYVNGSVMLIDGGSVSTLPATY